MDDYSRLILYATLVKKDTTWAHILALQTVILQYGLPYSYYVDSRWRKHHLLTDEATPQWKQVLEDCNVKVTYALSPQAKGKMERPYAWLQDRIVRICVREDIADIKFAQQVLRQEIHRYNYRSHTMWLRNLVVNYWVVGVQMEGGGRKWTRGSW